MLSFASQPALAQTYNCLGTFDFNSPSYTCAPPSVVQTTSGDAVYASTFPFFHPIDINVTSTIDPTVNATATIPYGGIFSTTGPNSAGIDARNVAIGDGARSGAITITSNLTISTTGQNSIGVLARGLGSNGNPGGNGGPGGAGGKITIVNTAEIATTGDLSHGIFALSQGGNGGKGGDANLTSGAGSGGAGGVGDLVSVSSARKITTRGELADGIRAYSLSGTAGDGGGGFIFSGGASGGQGSPAGNVLVVLTNTSPTVPNSIVTSGNQSNGIAALSVGGFAGTGGSGGYFVSSGGGANSGGSGGTVTVNTIEGNDLTRPAGSVQTNGDYSSAILAESIGGGGGYGGAAGGAGAVGGTLTGALGAGGGAGGNGGAATINNQFMISTSGNFARGLFAQSVGGGGGDGGSAAGIVAYGGTGSGGGSGGSVTVFNQGSIQSGSESHVRALAVIANQGSTTPPTASITHGSVAIFAQSVGGGGGSGGDSAGAVSFGGSGASGGAGGAVTVTNSALRSSDAIVTRGQQSHGILAQSVGGGGGTGGDAVGAVSYGGNGGGGSASGGSVTVSNSELITTRGTESNAIFAQSVGGGGGAGGNSGGAISFGGTGGSGGGGGSVSVSNSAALKANGLLSSAIVAQSIGGGGGSAGTASGELSFGAKGGNGADGGFVTVTNSAQLASNNSAIFAQSIGGGGGAGSTAGGLGSFGGSGGGGGNARTVAVYNISGVSTAADDASAILAQSIGGGGGAGGGSTHESKSPFALSFGGSGGAGGSGGLVFVRMDTTPGNTLQSSQVTITQGQRSDAVHAQSIGGGGGAGGEAVAVSLSGSVAIGGSGGGGGLGGEVDVYAAGRIMTNNNDSRGIFAQSVGGGGGSGALSEAASVNRKDGYSIAVAIGGGGGNGGKGGNVTVLDSLVNAPVSIATIGDRSTGVLTQSIGGGGGDGGSSISLAAGVGISAVLALGGSGGNGGDGGAALTKLTLAPQIVTSGKLADGILTQSIGGGGGTGGVSLDGALGASGSGAGIALALGGSGGSGGRGGAAETDFNGQLAAHFDGSAGIVTQSIGGGGGNGGAATALAAGQTSFSLALGGKGGIAGDAGTSTVNLAQASVTTDGTNADAVLAQSIGGGGGNGGGSFAGSAALSAALALSIGGNGGDGGLAGQTSISASGTTIVTTGALSSGVVAQSIGGGGGNGGMSVAGTLNIGVAGLSVALGGSGAAGGVGGRSNVTLSSGGSIKTTGTGALGVLAQSIGGGGGSGGVAVAGGIAVDTVSLTLALGSATGGGGGTGAHADQVSVQSGSTISTAGDNADAILAQSIGNGGGNGGYSFTPLAGNRFGDIISLGAVASTGGSSGAATLANTGAITTTGAFSTGLAVQSIAGGGGNAADIIGGSFQLVYGLSAQFGGASLNGGSVSVLDQNNLAPLVSLSSTGSVSTSGLGAHALIAQSIGGGGGSGGYAINGAVSFSGYDSRLLLGGGSGTGNFSGAVSVSAGGTASTSGLGAAAIVAQSIGGGGGDSLFSFTIAGPNPLVLASDAAALKLSLGANGGSGNYAGNVTLASTAAVATLGVLSDGILAQSIGGGGGEGSFNLYGTLQRTLQPLTITLGSSSDSGDQAGVLTIASNGNITTSGEFSSGIVAQSIAGGGGQGIVSGTLSSINGYAFAGSVTLGGSGSNGADANTVSLLSSGAIATLGDAADGLLAQSIGGGGGRGGLGDVGAIASLKLGGTGDAGNGSQVTVTNSGGVATSGLSAKGIIAQSIGGGGGVGLAANFGTVVLGGSGSNSGSGGSVSVTNSATLVGTNGDTADALFAQSIGGGGGVATTVGTSSMVQSASAITLGGSAGNSGSGSSISIDNSGALMTKGRRSTGIIAQSIGGGGGDAAGAFGTLILGGSGSSGSGGSVTVNNRSGGAISTLGLDAYGILAQSISGGGGRAGTGNSTQALGAIGSSGVAGLVTINNDAVVQTRGLNAFGIVAQSIGGGGGIVGDAAGQTALGNRGGTAPGRDVKVMNTGTVATSGIQAIGIVAQSVGGGGGVTTETAAGQNVTFGPGRSAAGGDAGSVSVSSTGTITTTGLGSYGIFEQSVGGGGGLVLANNLAENYSAPAASLDKGSSGDANLTVSGSVSTSGNFAHGVVVEVVGGGGGLGGGLDTFRLDPASTSFAGSAGGQGAAGAINATVNGSITTTGANAAGVVLLSFAPNASLGGPIRTNGAITGLTVVGTIQATGAGSDAIVARSVSGRNADKVSVSLTATARVISASGYAAWLVGTSGATIDNQGLLSGSIGGGAITLYNRSTGTFTAGPDLAGASGTLSIQNSGIMNIGAVGTIQKSTMTGTLTQLATGSLGVDVDGSSATSDLLQINGSASLAGKITVNLINFANAKPGDQTVKFLTATGGVSTSGLTLVRSPSALVDVRLIQPDQGSLAISYGVDFAADSFGTTGNRRTLGLVFDDLQQTGGSAVFNAVAPRFFAVETADDLGAAYDQLSGDGTVAAQEAAFRASDQFVGDMVGETGQWLRTAAAPHGNGAIWGAFTHEGGSLAGQATAGTARLTTRINSWTLGVDRVFGSFLIGGAIGFDHSDFAAVTHGTAGTSNDYRVGLYGAWRANHFYISGAASLATYDTHIRRTIAALGLTETVLGSETPWDYGLRLEAGRSFKLKSLVATPFAAIASTELRTPAYTEIRTSGDDVFRLHYQQHSAHKDETSLGLRLNSATDGKLQVYVEGAWLHSLRNTRSFDAEFAELESGAFTITGATPETDRAKVNAGIDLRLSNRVNLHASYAGLLGRRTVESAERASLSLQF